MITNATQDTKQCTRKWYTAVSSAFIAEQISLIQLFLWRIWFLTKVAYKRNMPATVSTRQLINVFLMARVKAATRTRLNSRLTKLSPTQGTDNRVTALLCYTTEYIANVTKTSMKEKLTWSCAILWHYCLHFTLHGCVPKYLLFENNVNYNHVICMWPAPKHSWAWINLFVTHL